MSKIVFKMSLHIKVLYFLFNNECYKMLIRVPAKGFISIFDRNPYMVPDCLKAPIKNASCRQQPSDSIGPFIFSRWRRAFLTFNYLCLNARFSSYYPNTIPFILGAKSIVNHKGARLIEMVLIQQLKSLWRVQTSCTEIFLKLFHQPTVTLNNIF